MCNAEKIQPTQAERLINHAADNLTGMNILFRRFVQVQGAQDLSKIGEIVDMAGKFSEALRCLEVTKEV